MSGQTASSSQYLSFFLAGEEFALGILRPMVWIGGQTYAAGMRGAEFHGRDTARFSFVANLTGGSYHTAETAQELQEVFAALPTTLITKREPVEISVGFLGLGFALAAAGVLLGRMWRPLP